LSARLRFRFQGLGLGVAGSGLRVEDSRVPGCGSTCCAYDGGGKAVGAFIIIGGAAFWARIVVFPNTGGVLYTSSGSWA